MIYIYIYNIILYNVYIICIILYKNIRDYPVRLLHPWRGDSQGQETLLAY